jgi:hypothetical protein
MNLPSKQCFAALALATMSGCRDDGFDIEFHMPVAVDRIELTIDTSAGDKPRHVGGRVYAIDLDHSGKAAIDSAWPVTRYHREFIVTPTKRLRKNEDFQVIDSGWRMNKTRQQTPRSVTSKTKLDGSVFWMEIEKRR